MQPDAPAALVRKVFTLLAQTHVAERADRCGWAGTWGVDVLQSSQFNAGEAVLLDTTLFGRVGVRESLVLRVGYSGTDFTDNVVRQVGEERLNLAVERPAAICWIKNLPTAAPTTTTTKAAAKK